MHNFDLIFTLTGGLAAALLFGYVTFLLRLSPIVGYLLAGIAVGSHTPGFIANQHLSEQIAEIGIILLMFGVGLHFHLKDLLAVAKVAIPGAIVQSVVATVLGATVARAFGWSWEAGFVFGLSLAVASTVVLTRVLVDNRDLHTPVGHVAIGWLIVEDLFTVLVLVVLPVVFGESGKGDIGTSIFFAACKVAVLAVGTVFLGGKVIPWLFTRAARSTARELFTLTVLVTVLGIAVGSALLFNVSMALGAFLAGMVVGRTEFSFRAASEAMPMRDAFSVLFFVSVGMLLDPRVLIDHPALVAATLTTVIVGKAVAAFVIVLLLGYPLKMAIAISVALAQIGEFSFILAGVGKELGLLDDVAMHCLVATAIVSITLNPLLYRLVSPMNAWIESRPRLSRFLTSRLSKRLDGAGGETLEDERIGSRPRAIIVGYGPTGKTVHRLLRENGVDVTIIEMNVETVRALARAGDRAVYGDACLRRTLETAGAAGASVLIVTSSSIESPKAVVREAKQLNADIRILARTSYLREVPDLKNAGCDFVFADESEVALALIGEILQELGASSSEIFQHRSKIYDELIESVH